MFVTCGDARKSPDWGVTITDRLDTGANIRHHVNMSKKPQGGVVLVPDKTKLKSYLNKGMTQKQIVEQWEADSGIRVSRSAIAMAINRYGLESAKPRARYEDMLPWRVIEEHRMATEARLLRMEARRRRGLPLDQEQLTWLTHWREELDKANAVVTYDPNTVEGFFWVHREPTDDDIIRRPKDKPQAG